MKSNQKPVTSNQGGNGFTLVELLAVILIISLLMGITIPVLRSAYSRSKTSKAKADIAKLEAAAEMYKSDWGSYPTTGITNLYNGLKAESPVTKKPYLTFKSKDLKNNQVIDSWGLAYVYTAPGSHNANSVDIYSFGPNKTDDSGTGDDINNWSR